MQSGEQQLPEDKEDKKKKEQKEDKEEEVVVQHAQQLQRGVLHTDMQPLLFRGAVIKVSFVTTTQQHSCHSLLFVVPRLFLAFLRLFFFFSFSSSLIFRALVAGHASWGVPLPTLIRSPISSCWIASLSVSIGASRRWLAALSTAWP